MISENIEAVVLRVVAELLDQPGATLTDDFFKLGGDSMSAMHFVGRVGQETGRHLRVKKLFEGPVLGDFANYITGIQAAEPAAGASQPVDPLERLRQSFALQQTVGSGI